MPRTTTPSPSSESGPTEKLVIQVLGYSLLHDEGKAVLALKGIIELNQVHVAELVHDVDLILHILLAESDGKGVSKKWVRKMSWLCLPRHMSTQVACPPCFLLSNSHIRFPTQHPNQVLTTDPTVPQIGNLSPRRKPGGPEGACCPKCEMMC